MLHKVVSIHLRGYTKMQIFFIKLFPCALSALRVRAYELASF